MKKTITIFYILFFCLSYAQTTQLNGFKNYFVSVSYLDEDTIRKSETVQYLDELGRPNQIINIKQTPSENDIVTHVEYDQFGRRVKNFLPAPQLGTINGNNYTVTQAQYSSVYGNERIFYEKVLESSPLNRLKQQILPGNDWMSNPINIEYNLSVSDAVRRFTTTTTWENGASKSILVDSGLYQDKILYKTVLKDEDTNETHIFKNNEGQIILVRKFLNATEKANTYYVYNEYNQLVYIVPPLASIRGDISSDVTKQNELCYQYKYDDQNRLVEKKLPGRDFDSFIYDQQSRLVATQDGNLRAKGHWLYTKYDKFGRIAISGLFAGGSRFSEQTDANNLGINNVLRTSAVVYNRQGMDVYYDKPDDTYPISSKWIALLTINYYDSYPNYSFNPTHPSSILGQLILTHDSALNDKSTKSLPVMSLTKNIENDEWTKNYIYYDNEGRLVGSYNINNLNGYTINYSKLDFAGIVKESKTIHKRSPVEQETHIDERFTYDEQNRLKKHYHKVDNQTEELLSDISYNELSEISQKKVGGNDISGPIQVIDYNYNIHGWLTKINDPLNLGNKLFGFEIKYQNPTNENVAPRKYNGNISEVDWKTSNDMILRRYGYQYDKNDRLKKAVFQEPYTDIPVNEYYNEDAAYDINGNIQTLNRYQKPDTGTTPLLIDGLNYTYSGNTLMRVFDTSGNFDGFKDDIAPGGYDSSNDYGYDINGNMLRDDNKQITSIKYNHLDLPFEILLANNNKINYTYSADGTKIKKVQSIYNGGSTIYETTDYLDGFQYLKSSADSNTNAKLLFFPTSGGYYNKNINTNPYAPAIPAYIYQYKDQVGNVRINYYKNPNTNILTVDNESNYYPFGLEHKKYNNISGNTNYQFKFQGQEAQKEVGWYSFKWRNYDASVGRFFNADPLSEKFSHQSHYNFSENRVVDAVELEGLEAYVFNGGDMVINGLSLLQSEYTLGADGIRNIAEVNVGTYPARSSALQNMGEAFSMYGSGTKDAFIDYMSSSWNTIRHPIDTFNNLRNYEPDPFKDFVEPFLNSFTGGQYEIQRDNFLNFRDMSRGNFYSPGQRLGSKLGELSLTAAGGAIGKVGKLGGLSKIRGNATLYRNFGWNELSSIKEAGGKFSIHPDVFQAKQFWVGESGMEMWTNSSMAKPFTAKIKIPKSFVTPGHKNYIFMEADMIIDGFPGGTVLKENLKKFNSSIEIEWIRY
jgi:RHS repeat-associated protein